MMDNVREVSGIGVRLTPRQILLINLAVITILIGLHLVGRWLRFGLGYDYAWGFVPFSNLNGEKNLSTLYSALLFFLNGAMCALLARSVKLRGVSGQYTFWLLACAVAFGLGIDEWFILHERLDEPVRRNFGVGGYFHYGWIIPYLLGLLILGILSFRGFRLLPRRLRRQLMGASAVFLVGAIGLEMISGKIASVSGVMNAPFLIISAAEEVLEMLGLTLSLAALWEHRLGLSENQLIADVSN